MTDPPVTPACASSKRLILFAGLALLLVPVSGRTDTGNLLITAEAEPAVVSMVAPTAKQQSMRSDNADNVMVRYGDISLTVNCGDNEAADAMRERAGLLSPAKEAANLGNLNFKVGFAF